MIAGKTRAAFVGAGVLLAVSLLLSITDHMVAVAVFYYDIAARVRLRLAVKKDVV